VAVEAREAARVPEVETMREEVAEAAEVADLKR
jgi:hypothetical protein